ncbi:hypothetical protein BC834DRAFT_868764 [Gloeopeniophorella convolvens]|nr:hypothetical protein BC834DRAFT_868764 [Gloeopeniophorella convolvens]
MPVTYSRPSSRQSAHLTDVTDADSSIVLSDLVRSGEVSRLRRRGAIAIRDTSTGQAAPAHTDPTPSAPPLFDISQRSPISHTAAHPEPDSSETDDDDAERDGTWRWYTRSRPDLGDPSSGTPDVRLYSPDAETHPEDGDGDLPYMLFCGGRRRDCDSTVSPDVPSAFDPPARHRASAFRPPLLVRRPSHSRIRRTNGCGALVHASAQPRRRQGTWVACGAATETVVRMDSRYFDCCFTVKMIKSACGCVREGVGCRVCGNPLGIISIPCQAAADGPYISQTPSTSSPSGGTQSTPCPFPLQPCGPAYWLPAANARQDRRSGAKSEIYHFFSETVRSAPEFTFPPSTPSRSSQPSLPGAFATPTSQRPPATSTPAPFASRQSVYPFPVFPPARTQSQNLLWEGQSDTSQSDDASQPEDDTEGDSTEKFEDPSPQNRSRIPWAER